MFGVLFIRLLISCNAKDKPQHRISHIKSNTLKTIIPVRLISNTDDELFTGVSSQLIIDTNQQSNIKIDHAFGTTQLTYTINDSILTNMTGSIAVNTSLDTCMLALKKHFSRFKAYYSHSKTYHTWILPLKGRPLIEVNAFVGSKTIELEMHMRQHI